MEPITASVVAAAGAEKSVEAMAIGEWTRKAVELGHASSEWSTQAELQLNQNQMETMNQLLDQDKYKKLAEFRELSQSNPETLKAAYNDVNLKGQMGECIMESKLSQVGEVKSQVAVQLEGAETGNKIDLQLVESQSNLKQTELTFQDGQIVPNPNYDVVKGDSASFEVKNGGLPYLRQELLNGELQQQIAAGKQLSDHSFVVINQDTAKALMQNSTQAQEIIQMIQDAGGKLVVGVPSTSVQMALFLS